MYNNIIMTTSHNHNSLSKRTLAIVAAASIGGGAVGAALNSSFRHDRGTQPRATSTASAHPKATESAPVATKPAAVALKAEQAKAAGQIKANGLAIAHSILKDLSKPTAGAETYVYNQYHNVGNKGKIGNPKSTVEKPLPNYPRYRNVPEMLMTYDAKLNVLNFSATGGTTVKVGENKGQEEFTSADVEMTISPTSAIAKKANTGKVYKADFESALSDPSLKVIAVSTDLNWGYNEKTKNSFGTKNVGAILFNGQVYEGNDVDLDGVDRAIQSNDAHVYTPDRITNPVYSDAGKLALQMSKIEATLPTALEQLSVYSYNQIPASVGY
jgi:hypothetical protein